MKRKIAVPLTISIITFTLLFTSTMGAFTDSIGHENRPMIKIKEGTSSNWSGYDAQSSITTPSKGFVKSVSGNWIVPKVTCGISTTYSSVWVGLDGVSDATVEQLGTEQDCSRGGPHYYAWYEMYPHSGFLISGMTIHSGDSMTASVKFQGNGQYLLSLSDLTTSKSFSHIFLANAQRSSAEWIVEAPSSTSGILPLTNFGSVSFSNAQFMDNTGIMHTIDGRGTGTYDSITLNDPLGGNGIPSSLTDSGTTSSFTVTYSP